MRRFLAWIGIALAAGGFILLALSIWLNIYYLIPIGMILGAFICLLFAKRMPADNPEGEKTADQAPDEKKDEEVSSDE